MPQAVDTQTWTITPLSPPLAPTGLHAVSVTATAAEFAWDAVAGATDYYVKWSDGITATTQQTDIQRSDLTPGQPYTVSVQAASAGGLSPAATASFATQTLPPAGAQIAGITENGLVQTPFSYQLAGIAQPVWGPGVAGVVGSLSVQLKNVGGTAGVLAIRGNTYSAYWRDGGQISEYGTAPLLADQIPEAYSLTGAYGPDRGFVITGTAEGDAGLAVAPGASVTVTVALQFYGYTIGGPVTNHGPFTNGNPDLISLQAGVLDANGNFTATGAEIILMGTTGNYYSG